MLVYMYQNICACKCMDFYVFVFMQQQWIKYFSFSLPPSYFPSQFPSIRVLRTVLHREQMKALVATLNRESQVRGSSMFSRSDIAGVPHTHTRTHIHTCTHLHSYIHAHVHISTPTRSHMHTCIYSCTNILLPHI